MIEDKEVTIDDGQVSGERQREGPCEEGSGVFGDREGTGGIQRGEETHVGLSFVYCVLIVRAVRSR
jgi:hypothetical protein